MKIKDNGKSYMVLVENNDDALMMAKTFFKYVKKPNFYTTVEMYVDYFHLNKEYIIHQEYKKDIQYMLREEKLKRILE